MSKKPAPSDQHLKSIMFEDDFCKAVAPEIVRCMAQELRELRAELARRDAAAGELVAWRYRFTGKPGSAPFTSEWKIVSTEDECNPSDCFERQALYTAARPAVLPWKFKECHHCESKSLTWDNTVRSRSGIQDGRLKANEMSCVFYLGCDECSETLAQIQSDDVAEFLNLVQKAGVKREVQK